MGGLVTASGGLANALGGLATTPEDVFFRWGGGGGSARAQKDGRQVLRAALKKFLTEDEDRHEQWKAIQAVHPRSTWTSQDKERSTECLVDDYSPLVQPTMHAVAEEELEPGRLQEGIDLLHQTQEVVSAVKRSATRKRVRPPRNSTTAARDTRRGTAENTISPANSPGTEEKDEIATNSRTTEMCNENDEGLGSAAAIAFGNLLCEKKPIDWCEAQSRDTTARLVIKLLRAKAKREDITADELKNRDIDPDEVWRLLGQCQLIALPDHDNRKLLVRHPTREPVPRPNRKPGRYECLLRYEPMRVYVPLRLQPWVMDRTHKEAVHLDKKVSLAMLERYSYWVGKASSVK